MDRRRALDPVQRRVQRLQSILARLLRTGLHVRLVDLHHVGARGEQVADLLIDRLGVVHGQAGVVGVADVLSLLLHGEGAGHGDLHRPICVGLEELQGIDLDRTLAPDLAGDAGRGNGVARAVQRLARILQIDPLQGVGETVGVALAAHLPVGDDVDTGALLIADGDDHGIVLGFFQEFRSHAPQTGGRRAGRKARAQRHAVDQPVGLGVGSHQGRRK